MGIRFTHTLDLAHQLAVMAGGIAVVGAVTAIIQPITTPIEQLLVGNELGWV